MASWKENKLVGLVAGAIFLIAMGILAAWRMSTPAPLAPELRHQIPATPTSTPYVKSVSTAGGE